MKKKLILIGPVVAVSLLSANTSNFSEEKINNLGKGVANLIIKVVPNYHLFTNSALCYKAIDIDFDKSSNKTFYTGILKGVDNPSAKENIISVCEATLQDLRAKK